MFMICNLIMDVKYGRKMCLNPNDVNKKDFYTHEIFDCFFILTVVRWNLIHRVAVKGDFHTLNLTFGQKKAPKLNVLGLNLAPPAGLEPATS